MKISKCKKELARIIREHGGWRDGEFAAQDGDGLVGGYGSKPEWNSLSKYWWREAFGGWFLANKIKNHHQTVLSRAEYFHLYPAADADATDKLSSEAVSAAKIALMSDSIEELVRKPTIEQLAADYRNAKDYANRKQQEADDAKAAADEALGELERAGEALGLVIGVAMPDPELVITDWRDLMERDVIWFDGDDEQAAGEYSVLEVEHANYGGNRAIRIDTIGNDYWIDVTDDWKFIRRP